MSACKNLVATYQRFASPLPTPGDAEYLSILETLKEAGVFIFPEYFAFYSELPGAQRVAASEEALLWLKKLSCSPEAHNTLIFGGSLYESSEGVLFNSVPVLFNGEIIARYHKRRLYKKENSLFSPGQKPLVVAHPVTGEKWGVLVCADVYLPGIFEEYKEADHIALPTASPWRKDDTPEAQEGRDREIYQKGASLSGATLHKSCITGFLSNEEDHGRVQGRSLIASPEAVLIRAPHIEWHGALLFDRQNRGCFLKEF